MIVNVSPNKIEKIARQSIDLSNDKIITLVGENGSGKSAILERVFTDFISNNNITLISFTSGQNECFTDLFYRHLRESKKFLIEGRSFDIDEANNEKNRGALSSFHFDQTWVRLLIFFATTIKPNGRTRDYLLSKQLVSISDDNLNDDVTTTLEFRFRILSDYLNKLRVADKKEAEDYNYRSLRRSLLHRYLEKIVTAYQPTFDFTNTTNTKKRMLLSKDAFYILGKDVREIFTFLGQAVSYNTFIEKHTIKLYFKGGLELVDLSDGEFQLLSIYSLIDLFDDESTLFLFDEIDSHIHYNNTKKLWSFLKQIKGKLLTTTHSADSILLHAFKSIKLVSQGKVEQEHTAEHLFNRFASLSDSNTYIFKVAAKFEYIALVENKFDWKLFTLLAQRKVANYNPLFEQIKFIKCSSGYNNAGQSFADTRRKWVEDFKKITANSSDTKAIFFICDRDSLPLGNISGDGVSVNGTGEIPTFREKIKPYILGWKRKEIENYLVSHTMLSINNEIANFQSEKHVILYPNSNSDNDVVRNLEVKAFFQRLYLKDGLATMDNSEEGVDYNKLSTIISQIPPEEISQDIENMYNFIISKMSN